MHVRLDIGMCTTRSVSRECLWLMFAKAINHLKCGDSSINNRLDVTSDASARAQRWYLHGNYIITGAVLGFYFLSVQPTGGIQSQNNVIRKALSLPVEDSVCSPSHQLLSSLTLVSVRGSPELQRIKTESGPGTDSFQQSEFTSTNATDTTPEVLKCNSFRSIKFKLENDLDRIHKEGAGGVIMNVFLLNESLSPALGPNLHIRPLIELFLWCFCWASL